MAEIRYLEIKVRDLPGYIEEFLRRPEGQEILPITPQRALSQSLNPATSPEDTGLYVALDGDRVAGYLGSLPGRMLTEQGPVPVTWPSAFLVSPRYRGKGIGQGLYQRLFKNTRNVIFAEVTHEARALYGKMGAQPLGKWPYLRVEWGRPSPSTLFFKGVRRLAGKFAPRLADRLVHGSDRLTTPWVRGFLNSALKWRWRRELRALSMRIHDRIPVGARIVTRTLPCFERSRDQIEWMIGSPWVTDQRGPLKPPYHFSDVRDRFFYEVVELDGDAHSILVLSISWNNGITELKWVDSPGFSPDTARRFFIALLARAIHHRADVWNFVPVEFASFLKGFPGIVMRREREYLFWPETGQELARNRDKIQFASSDGDAGFW